MAGMYSEHRRHNIKATVALFCHTATNIKQKMTKSKRASRILQQVYSQNYLREKSVFVNFNFNFILYVTLPIPKGTF